MKATSQSNPAQREPLSVLVVAHGSRSEEANRHFIELVKRLAHNLNDDHRVEHAFLEMAEPDIVQGLERLSQRGARRIHLLPYFLSPGRHVERDVPAQVDRFRAQHAGAAEISVVVLPYFGADTDTVVKNLSDLIERSVG